MLETRSTEQKNAFWILMENLLYKEVSEGPKNRFEENILDGLNSQNMLLEIVTVPFSVQAKLLLIFWIINAFRWNCKYCLNY